MKTRVMSVCVSAIFAAVVLLFAASDTQAANILVSGNSIDQFNTRLTGAIAGLGHTAVFVAPVNFAATNLAGFDAVWLDGFSQYGAGAWPDHLLAFMNTGGNVFVQNPGFGTEALSVYPLGAQLSATFTFPPGYDTISIVDATSPPGANHPVNAGLTNAGLSQWGPSAFGHFSNIGAFTGLTTTGTPGQWVTIVAAVGAGHLVYTQQGVSEYLGGAANPGPGSAAARFLDNVVTLATAGARPELIMTLTGCTACRAGDRFTVQGRITNLSSRVVSVEAKVGVRLPDGTTVSVLGNKHLETGLAAHLDTTVTLFDVPSLPAGLPTGTWTFEGTLLGPDLGETFSRQVKPFAVLP